MRLTIAHLFWFGHFPRDMSHMTFSWKLPQFFFADVLFNLSIQHMFQICLSKILFIIWMQPIVANWIDNRMISLSRNLKKWGTGRFLQIVKRVSVDFRQQNPCFFSQQFQVDIFPSDKKKFIHLRKFLEIWNVLLPFRGVEGERVRGHSWVG